MILGEQLLRVLNASLRRRGKIIIPLEQLYDWHSNPEAIRADNSKTVSAEARNYLKPDNPRLIDLQKRYATCDPEVINPLLWTDQHISEDDILYFRGDNAYVYQLRGRNSNIIGYTLSTYYTQRADKYDLINKMVEDEVFGNYTFEIAGHKVSRDLLDSINEINFLDRHLNLMSASDVTILDIGAGYGRLAYRMATVVPGLAQYVCTDAVSYSSFISEFYLNYRKAEKTKIVPLDEIEQCLASENINIAVNIHSFSECRLEAIEWWVSRLSRAEVKHFMIVPNPFGCGGVRLQTHNGNDFSPILERHGYRLLTREPKYRDPVIQQYALHPTHYFLFELH